MSIESPCIQLCQIDPERALCRGCGRTLQEIARWSAYTPAERRRIMNDLQHELNQPAQGESHESDHDDF
jgi:predicted Fe-S protein YdhL (DUF1289 family)